MRNCSEQFTDALKKAFNPYNFLCLMYGVSVNLSYLPSNPFSLSTWIIKTLNTCFRKKISDDNSLLIIYKQTYMIHLRLSFNFIDIHSWDLDVDTEHQNKVQTLD